MDTSRAPISKYAGLVATGVWTLGWVVGAVRAVQYVQHLAPTRDHAAMLSLFITFACSALGSIMTYRIARPRPDLERPEEEKKPEVAESLSKRITGWFGAVVWCGVAALWNVAIFGTVARSATNGNAFAIVLMVPFSLIGWFLLNLLFVGIGLLLDPLFARDETMKRWP